LKADDAYKNLVKTLEQASVSWKRGSRISAWRFKDSRKKESAICANEINKNKMARQMMVKCFFRPYKDLTSLGIGCTEQAAKKGYQYFGKAM